MSSFLNIILLKRKKK